MPAPPAPAPEPVGELVEPVEGPPDLLHTLIQIYQALGHHIDLPFPIPYELTQHLAHTLTHEQHAAADHATARVIDQIESALTGYLRLPPWYTPAPPEQEFDAILTTIENAIATQQDIRITYWAAQRSEKTTRRLTPYWLEQQHNTLYLHAYCHLRQQERIFRLDRITECTLLSPQKN